MKQNFDQQSYKKKKKNPNIISTNWIQLLDVNTLDKLWCNFTDKIYLPEMDVISRQKERSNEKVMSAGKK